MNYLLSICSKKIQVFLLLILGLLSATHLSAKELQSAIDIKIQNLASADDKETLAAIFINHPDKFISSIDVCYSDASVSKSEANGYKYYLLKKHRLETKRQVNVGAFTSYRDVNVFHFMYKDHIKKKKDNKMQTVPPRCDYYLDYPKNIIKIRDFLLKNNINSFSLQNSITKSELESYETKRRKYASYIINFMNTIILNENSFTQTISGGLRQRYDESHLSICFSNLQHNIGWEPSVEVAAVVDYMNLNKSLFGIAEKSVITDISFSSDRKGCRFKGSSPHFIYSSYEDRFSMSPFSSSPFEILIDLESTEIEYLLAKNAKVYAEKIEGENISKKNIELEYMRLVESDDKAHLVGLGLKKPDTHYKENQEGSLSICTSKASNIPSYQLRGYMQSLKGMKMGGDYLISNPIHTKEYPNIDEFYTDLLRQVNISLNLNYVNCNLYIDYPKNTYLLQNAMLKAQPKYSMSRWGVIADPELKTYAAAWQKDLDSQEIERVAQAERARKRKEAENAAYLQRQQQQAANDKRVRSETIALEANMRQKSLGQGFPFTARISCEVASAGVGGIYLQSCLQNLELTNGSFYHNYTTDMHNLSDVNTYNINILPLRSTFDIKALTSYKLKNLRINFQIVDNKSGTVVFNKSYVHPGEWIMINQRLVYGK